MGKLSLSDFLRSQFTPVPLINADLTGQTVIVTGANTGLGLAAAKQFAKMNPERLIFACRNRQKAEEAIETLKKETGYTRAELKIFDQGSFAGVTTFVDELAKEDARIDVFLANAGINTHVPNTSSDGWESSYQVNHLSASLLGILLLPLLYKSASKYNITPRLTFVNTDLHYYGRIPSDLVNDPKGLLRSLSDLDWAKSNGHNRYCTSKLVNLLFLREVNDRLAPATPLVLNSTHPGVCRSEITRDWKFPANVIFGLVQLLLARTEEQGAAVLTWAALAGTAGEKNDDLRDRLRGAYVTDARISEPSDWALGSDGKRAQDKVWTETIDILKAVNPQVEQIVNEYLTRA